MRRDLARHAVLNPPAFRTRAAAHRRCAGAGKWWRCACWVVLLLCAGCGYSSSYVPPVDGRARVVWNSRDSEAVASLSGLELSQDCQQAIGQMTGQKRMPLDDINQGIVQFPEIATEHTVARPEMRTYGGYWVPRYYGPNIVVVQPGLPPVFPRPPLYVPFAARPHIGLSHSSRGGSIGGFRPSGMRLGGGNGDAGKGLALLAAVAIVVMPVISITLATVRPESERQASEAIDGVNAINDLVRFGPSPCVPGFSSAEGVP